MSKLVQMVYSSVAAVNFATDDLIQLLAESRLNNSCRNITGMLLYDQGCFFQVLEGNKIDVEHVLEKIKMDSRHRNIVTIINVPISKRSFEDWSMGYADVSTEELSSIDGLSNFLEEGMTFEGITPGRAKKLLNAFRQGRWHSRIIDQPRPEVGLIHGINPLNTGFSIEALENVYQPVYSANDEAVFAYEVKSKIPGEKNFISDDKLAIKLNTTAMAEEFYKNKVKQLADFGREKIYSLNFYGSDLEKSETLLATITKEIELANMSPEQFILEIHQSYLIGSTTDFGTLIQEYRSYGYRFLIDHFGAGKSGLNLLEPYRPDLIALNQFLIKNVHSNGARQAIILGLIQTCHDLAIDVVAKFITETEEYLWLREAGVDYIQSELLEIK